MYFRVCSSLLAGRGHALQRFHIREQDIDRKDPVLRGDREVRLIAVADVFYALHTEAVEPPVALADGQTVLVLAPRDGK